MALSVLLLCPLTESSTCSQVVIKISIVSAILRGTVITSIKERCAWDSGSEIAPDMETLMGTGWQSVSRVFVEEVPKAQA